MGLFNNYLQFAFETIEENLFISKIALDTPKTNDSNSCYGMPALVLLSSSIDIIGTFYHGGSFVTISPKMVLKRDGLGHTIDHFKQFHNDFLTDVCDENLFIEILYSYARCKATHNGVLVENVFITIEDNSNSSIVIEQRDGKKIIYLKKLYDIVKNSFDKIKLVSDVKYDSLPKPDTGATFSSQVVIK